MQSPDNMESQLMNQPLTPFHIAVQVRDIEEARRFYTGVLGCTEGRSSDHWVDFNLFGHQFVCHLNPELGRTGKLSSHYNPVDGQGVPVPHCGVVLRPAQWDDLAARVKRQGIPFVVEPYTRFKGQTGEQSTMFFLDPSGNALEFKAFQDIEKELFAVDAPAG
jgi:uncharacterized protein